MLLSSKFLSNFYKYKRKLNCYAKSIVEQHRKVTTHADKCTAVKGNILRVLFFGTDHFSLPSLKALHTNSTHNSGSALGVVTSFKSPANCIRIYAEQEKLPLHRWPIATDVCRDYDLGIVVSFGHLIPEHIIKAFPLGMINVHASLLPRWRGAAPIIYALMHGDATTGVSIMKIEPKHFDIGDILAQREVPIEANILMPALHAELAKEGANLLLRVVNDFPKSVENAKKQNKSAATLAPKITAAVTEVIWSEMNATQLYNRYRALYSFKYLHTQFESKNVQFIDIKLPTKSNATLANPGSFTYQRDRKCLVVCCAGNSHIEVHQLRLEGKKVMSAMDFNNGFLRKLKVEQLLFSNNKT